MGWWRKTGDRGEGKFERGQGAMFCWYNALLGSWWPLPWLYHGQPFSGNSGHNMYEGSGMGVPSISYWSVPDNVLEKQVPQWDWPVLVEITPMNFRFISMGSVVHGPSCFLYACLKVTLASSFISLFSFQYFCISLPFLHTPQRFFPHFTFTVSPGPSFLHPFPPQTPESPSPWVLTPSSHTLCSIPQPFGQGALLWPRETQCCDCLLLMSAPPHHLGKEGKSIKEMENTFLFLFYFIF